MAFQIRVATKSGEWAGNLYRGRSTPAIAGTLNQTGRSDEAASTFGAREEARAIAAQHVVPLLGELDQYEIVEV